MRLFLAGLVLCSTATAQSPPLVPRDVAPSKLVVRLLRAAYLTDEETKALRLKHGTWSDADLATPSDVARAAMIAGRFDHPAFADESVPVLLRARARLAVGKALEAIDLLDGVESIQASALRAEAMEQAGFIDATGIQADWAIEQYDATPMSERSIDDAIAAVAAMRVRARTTGVPSRDYQRMLSMLGTARDQIDRLDSRARVAEAELLYARSNINEAVPALHEALQLNPRSAAAWALLGEMAVDRFDFDGAETAAARLEDLGPSTGTPNAAATIVRALIAIVQDDPFLAGDLLDELLAVQPTHVPAIALRTAAAALRYDEAETALWLARLEEIAPNSAMGYYEVGRRLAFDRQYGLAAEMLGEAIARRPSWPAPHVELGLLEMQSGRDQQARAALEKAIKLDPFNQRAAFSLTLLKEMDDFVSRESEHFIVRSRPGIDDVIAASMLEPLEAMHLKVAERFGHEPAQKTVIELMPDHAFFSVRITGMPKIHTVAACTGPLIAIEVPREGAPGKHLGLFDWLKVLRHEYTHTITLSQTQNRIPHWLTEAAAVSMEGVPLKFETAKDLARRWRRGELFDLDEINWAFIRPKRRGDRGFAYAQGHWMVEYMNEQFGSSAIIVLLEEYFRGAREEEAMLAALGVSRAAFFEGFNVWAGDQVERWGLNPSPSLDELADTLRAKDPKAAAHLAEARRRRLKQLAAQVGSEVGQASREGLHRATVSEWPEVVRPPIEINDEALASFLETYPTHPDVLELSIRRRLGGGSVVAGEVRVLLERYAEARPVDPFPHRVLAQAFVDRGEAGKAIESFQALDARSEHDNIFALEVAVLLRKEGRLDEAQRAIDRAVRMNPYRPEHHELAAAIAIERRDFSAAKISIEALRILEPDQPHHVRRIEAIHRLLGVETKDR